MPIYQYQCTDCGHQLEALQKMSDPKLTDCPQCDTPTLRKQLTAAAFKLKGTGWYETDFKNSGKKPDSNAGSNTESKSENKEAASKNTNSSGGSESAANAKTTEVSASSA